MGTIISTIINDWPQKKLPDMGREILIHLLFQDTFLLKQTPVLNMFSEWLLRGFSYNPVTELLWDRVFIVRIHGLGHLLAMGPKAKSFIFSKL